MEKLFMDAISIGKLRSDDDEYPIKISFDQNETIATLVFPIGVYDGLSFQNMSSGGDQIDLICLREAAENYQVQHGRYLCVHFTITKAEPCDVILKMHGFVSHGLIQDHPSSHELSIRLNMTLSAAEQNNDYSSLDFISQEMKVSPLQTHPHMDEDNIEACISNEKYAEELFSTDMDELWPVVKSIRGDRILAASFKATFWNAPLDQQIRFDRRMDFPFKIYSKTGTKTMKCNAMLLHNNSKYFEGLLKNGMLEARVRSVTLDYDEDTLIAVIEYLYTGNISGLCEDGRRAFEVLLAAHYLLFLKLEMKMVTWILRKPLEWLAPHVALQIYIMATRNGAWNALKKKAIKVSQTKSEDEMKSPECLAVVGGKKEDLESVINEMNHFVL